jgi:hypothetical protein
MPVSVLPPASQRLEFDLRIDTVDNVGLGSAAAFAAILFGSEVNSGAVALSFSPGPTLSAVYLEPPDSGGLGFGAANATSPFPPLGTWDGRFAIEITYGTEGGAAACAQVYIGIQPQLSPCLKLPDSLSRPKNTAIAIGVYSGGAGNTGTVALQFDDVTYSEQ